MLETYAAHDALVPMSAVHESCTKSRFYVGYEVADIEMRWRKMRHDD